MPKIRRTRHLGPLHDLLISACPPDENGKQSVPILASHIGVTQQALYNLIKINRISPKILNKIIKINHDRPEEKKITTNDFLPYLF